MSTPFEKVRSRALVLTCLIISLIWLSSCAAPKVITAVPGPTLLPHTTRHMQMPGFWISRQPAPDQIILDSEQIEAFNRHIQDTLNATVAIMDEKNLRSGHTLRSKLEKDLLKFRHKPFFTRSGQPVSDEFLDEILAQVNIRGIREKIPVQYGVTAYFSHQRILPTHDPVYSEPENVDFDNLQNSALDLGTPVRILHETRDGQWWYVQSELSGGWVRSESIARCGREEASVWYQPQRFVVVTRAKADIFRTAELTDYHETLRMGVFLPLAKDAGHAVKVVIPLRTAHGDLVMAPGFLRASAVHDRYLPLTSRNIVQQAFELLNAPYGWGGMYGEQDCSRFIQEILATAGIRMPRNSSDQARVGQRIAVFSESADERSRYQTLADSAQGGLTILYLRGHIMLYLGQVDDRHYVIHSTYAYRISSGTAKQTLRINRVAVSDLSLGQGSRRGSLIDRLVSARKLSPDF